MLKRLDVPWVIAKAETSIHGEILRRIGTDRIVFPENEAGNQVAHSLEIRHAIAYMNLNRTSGATRLHVPPGSSGKAVADVEAKYPGISVLLIQRGHTLLPRPAPDTVLEKADIVLVAGLDEDLDAFADN